MLQPLFKVATLAIFFILLTADSTVSANPCEDRRRCEVNYNALEGKLDTANLYVYSNFTRLVSKLKLEKRQWNRIHKFTYELNNGCDFIPLNDMEYIWPYQVCTWLGYNYDVCVTYMLYGLRYAENLPVLRSLSVADCSQALRICNEDTAVAQKYITRKIQLSEYIQRILNNSMTTLLTDRADDLQHKVKSKLECPQYNGQGCAAFMNCTRQYQLKQQELENVLEQRYLQYALFYEEQGKQLKLKERLEILIKQNATQYGHCTIRPSSARNMTSPYQGLVYYAYKYLHMAPSGCSTANKQLPAIPGATFCLPMLIDCERLMKEANKLIADEKDDLKCLADLVASHRLYTESLKKLIKNLEKDVQKKINSTLCLACPKVEECNEKYLELQKNLNLINQEIQDEFLIKFEREDKQAILRDKGGRMKEKIRLPCNIVPVTTFKYVYPWNSCYWREYLMGISLEKAMHSFSPNLDKLPDLTQTIGVTKNCTVTEAECKKRLADGNILYLSRKIELEQLRKANKDNANIAVVANQLTTLEGEYARIAHLLCVGNIGDQKCNEDLLECKKSYNGTQERFDVARNMYQKEFTDYYELSGYVEKLTVLDTELNREMEARCETFPEQAKEMIRRPYLTPHEDAIRSQIYHLSIFLSHGPDGTVVENCTTLLNTCRRQLSLAESRITSSYSVAKYFFERDRGKCALARMLEIGIIKKIVALRELTAHNKNCIRVSENGRIFTYLYDGKLI